MDRYVEARAHYPKAEFSYVGHSNGTYLVARALRDYPAAQFKRIVLAGSVVRSDYDWQSLTADTKRLALRRVGSVLNYVATNDKVVAIFPKGLEPMTLFDLGGAGHSGFKQASPNGPVHQVEFIKGGHSAGHEEKHWTEIARFIVDGDIPNKETGEQDPLCKRLGKRSTWLLAALLVLILGIAALLIISIFTGIPGVPLLSTAPTGVTTAARTFFAMLYLWLVYIVLSRV